jgi:hypothetical protein
MSELPSDCRQFLAAGQQLSYRADESSIGPIRLNTASELVARTARLRPHRLPGIDDPYTHLDGKYELEVIDLVGKSDEYYPQGLLCWIPVLASFGSVDEVTQR